MLSVSTKERILQTTRFENGEIIESLLRNGEKSSLLPRIMATGNTLLPPLLVISTTPLPLWRE